MLPSFQMASNIFFSDIKNRILFWHFSENLLFLVEDKVYLIQIQIGFPFEYGMCATNESIKGHICLTAKNQPRIIYLMDISVLQAIRF